MTAARKIEYRGKIYTFRELEALSGIHHETIRRRMAGGMTVEQAVTTPVDPHKQRKPRKEKKKCKTCRFHRAGSGGVDHYCDYLCTIWDETGKPRSRMLICSAEKCTVYEPKQGRRKEGRTYGKNYNLH